MSCWTRERGREGPSEGSGKGVRGVAESQNVTELAYIAMWKIGESVKVDFNISCV